MASQIPLDISAIYLDNNYAQINFTTFTVVNPNYYYRAVAYDGSGNYYETRGLKSPITITGLNPKTNYSCFVELVQYSTSTFVTNKTLPWPKIYAILVSDVSYSSLKVSWTGVDISYLTITRAIGSAAAIDISTTAQYVTAYNDGDISGNTTYYYYVTPFSTYNGILNTGKKSATVSAKTLTAPPTNPSLVFYDSSSASVAFTAARNSYSTSYYYILRATDTLGRYIDASSSSSPIQNSDLSGNTTYTMRVISAIDNSLNLYATSATAVSATTKVRPPANVSVAFFDNSAISLTYAAGKNTYNTIYYTVYASDAPRNYYTTISGGTTTISISNLSGNTSYTLSVTNTLNGNAALSATTLYGTQLTLVQPPIAPYQTFLDSSSVSVSFVAGKNTYTSILYTATATSADGQPKQGTSSATNVTVGDLSGNTKYTVAVSVTLDGNVAITAAAATKVATRTYVQPPANLSTGYDSSSVTVSFPLPRNSYATSAYYAAYITDGIRLTTATNSGNVILIQGLSNSTNYSYYVKTFLTAKSAVGTVATYNPYPVLTTFTISDFSYNYVNLTWTGRDISYVRVTRTIGGAAAVDISNDNASPYYDSDISGNTIYSYYITPVRNYKGTLKVGAVSSTLVARTPVSPPKDLSAVYYDISSITLSFNSQKNSYTSFYYVARATNYTTGVYRDVSGITSPITITNLNGGAQYTCTVSIVLDGSQNLVGTSAPITVYTILGSKIDYIALVRYS